MVLLDANVLVWWMQGDERLGAKARQTLQSADAELLISLITLFEIELKQKAGKLRLSGPVAKFIEKFDVTVYCPLSHELSMIMNIDLDHSDPFDCALIGLAKLKAWPVLTSDKKLLELAPKLVTIIDSRR